ncbi:UBC-like protein [Pholiota conissans]|uniref:UBC-like protein n=1 Tax=Pholiota conissans TaxID=109636 RepID=A0A9P5YYR4_9AGAR|nr:UBC-like protein [Pholiota conissans]
MLAGFIAPIDRNNTARPATRAGANAPAQSASSKKGSPPTTADAGILTHTAISLEYASLINTGHCPLGIYVVPSTSSLLVWDAVFFVHQGYYADSILKFRLTFPPNYPESPPAVDFITDVFHPLISPKGSFNLAPRFKPWRPKEHHAFDVLHFIKVSFKKHALDGFTESDCFNKEAFRLYHDSTQSFAALATQSASLSQSESALFDSDHPSPLGMNASSEFVFHKMKPDELARERAKLGLAEWDIDASDSTAKAKQKS